MRYGLVAPGEFVDHYRKYRSKLAGLLAWPAAMSGDCISIDEDLTPYDVLHFNISSTELEYIPVAKMQNPDATIVANFDYSMDILAQYFISLERVRQIMCTADHVFSVTSAQRAWMEMILGRKVHHIPHPMPVEAAKEVVAKAPKVERKGVGIVWHQYDQAHQLAMEVVKALEKEKGEDRIPRFLLGLKTRWMAQNGIKVMAMGVPTYMEGPQAGQVIDEHLKQVFIQDPAGANYDGLMPYVDPLTWLETLTHYEVIMDPYRINSIGRVNLDAAIAGTPVVASDRTDTAHTLWGALYANYTQPEQVRKALALVLYGHEVWMNSVVETAQEAVMNYDLEPSKERFIKMLEDEQ
jgi:hypothetical protein